MKARALSDDREHFRFYSGIRARLVGQISIHIREGHSAGMRAGFRLRQLTMFPGSHDLAVLDQASRILAEAKSLDEIKAVRDKAEAARTYVKAAKLGLELQNRAAEVKLRAERKAGSLLRSLKLRGGDRKSKRHAASLKLQDLDITHDQSKRWQHIATIPDLDFCTYLKNMTEQGREITSAGLLRIAGKRPKTTQTNRPSSPSTVVSRNMENQLAEELLEELMNHCRLLGDVLRPVYEEANLANLELKRGEKRVVGRLIGEMTQLIVQLKKTWRTSGTAS